MNRWRNLWCGSSGSVAVMAALGLVMFLGFATLALDVGHMLSMKNELQRAADAGALAGARALWPTTLPVVSTRPSQNFTAAQSTALSVSTSANNKVDAATLPSDQVTVQTGRWDYAAQTFTVTAGANVNAVQVITRATASMFFAAVLGKGPINLSATAVAVADFASGVGKGTLPIAISQTFVAPGQSVFVNFTPDQVDNGAWFADPPNSANAKTFRDYIDDATCPPLNEGDMINLQNGQDTSVLNDLQNKLAQQGGSWDMVLPVVNTTTFTGTEPITGFVAFRITQVSTSQPKGVTGTFLGLYMSSTARPGGTNFGVLTTPKSVF